MSKTNKSSAQAVCQGETAPARSPASAALPAARSNPATTPAPALPSEAVKDVLPDEENLAALAALGETQLEAHAADRQWPVSYLKRVKKFTKQLRAVQAESSRMRADACKLVDNLLGRHDPAKMQLPDAEAECIRLREQFGVGTRKMDCTRGVQRGAAIPEVHAANENVASRKDDAGHVPEARPTIALKNPDLCLLTSGPEI